MIPKSSMQHLLEYLHQVIKVDKIEIRNRQFIQLNTGAKEIEQLLVNPFGLDHKHKISSQPSYQLIIFKFEPS